MHLDQIVQRAPIQGAAQLADREFVRGPPAGRLAVLEAFVLERARLQELHERVIEGVHHAFGRGVEEFLAQLQRDVLLGLVAEFQRVAGIGMHDAQQRVDVVDDVALGGERVHGSDSWCRTGRGTSAHRRKMPQPSGARAAAP
ncbi:hypothetical protein G6F65_015945 [Rhizopus arrhizus]|nr:hypothetical protein G6F65_015945 [Rhizopus arrhizus]